MADLLLDGFEDGTFDTWTATVTDGGDLSITEAAAIYGTYGVAVFIDDANAIYAYTDSPNAATRIRARCYIDPNGFATGSDSREVHFMAGIYSTSSGRFYVALMEVSGQHRIGIGVRNDAAGWTYDKVNITDAPHCIEVDWKASSAPAANDGYLKLWIDVATPTDDNLTTSLTGIDNDTIYIDRFNLGPWAGLGVGDAGTFYLDNVVLNNDGSLIGPIVNAYELSLTDGFKMGDTKSVGMTADVSRIDGMKGGDTIIESSVMALLKTDGFKIGDSETITALMELLKTDGFKLSDLSEIALARFIELITKLYSRSKTLKLPNRSLTVKLNNRNLTLKMRVK